MTTNRLRHQTAGFTIVEVLIVLAIGGMIFLIVFTAIPVLQRNARNGQRNNDVATMLSAVSSYELRHAGGFPACGTSGQPGCGDAPSGTTPEGFLYYAQHRLNIYTDMSKISAVPQTAGGAAADASAQDPETVQIYNYHKCNPDDGAHPSTNGAGYYDVVALYQTENGNNTFFHQCKQL